MCKRDNVQAPYTWDDPMNIMNANHDGGDSKLGGRDRFEAAALAAASVAAELGTATDQDLSELGFLQHDLNIADSADLEKPEEKQEL